MLFEYIGQYGAIARIAQSEVITALNAGYRVTVVTNKLDESLQGRVEWLKLYVPPRGFALQWLTARHFYKKALGNRKFDVIHAHQPQTASMADVFECHYLTRVAHETKSLDHRRSLRGRIVRAQQQIVLYAEDYYYNRFPAGTFLLFPSTIAGENYCRLYGKPTMTEVLPPVFPPLDMASLEDRRLSRKRLLGDFPAPLGDKLVVGYLGGIEKTKGYDRLINAIEPEANLFLLMGGRYSEGFNFRNLRSRALSLGSITDTRTFYAACDVVVVPSVHETFGMVVVEAAARGTPVIVTPTVGAAPHLTEFGAGLVWNPAEPLGPLVRQAAAQRRELNAGTVRMADQFSAKKRAARLVEIWERAAAEKRKT